MTPWIRLDGLGVALLISGWLFLLLVCHLPGHHVSAHLDDVSSGICQRKYIRNEPYFLESLRGCRVIEGSLQLALMQTNDSSNWANYSYPELREITGYLLIFEVSKLPSLRTLFPNLAVIRGQELIDTHSLVVQGTSLQELGLPSLTNIQRGSVWIVDNPQLCYVETIDWNLITNEPVSEGIVGNKPANQCPNACHPKCPRKSDGSGADQSKLCWSGGNATNCQKVFNSFCPLCFDAPCTQSGECCSSQCLGGCSGPTVSDCFVCKHVVYEGTCMEECPPGFYEYASRRCVNREECLETRAAPDVSKGISHPLQGKLFEQFGKKLCVLECPKNTELSPNKTTCVPCNGQCRKNCPGIQVDSVEKARELAGCTRITGVLKINIRKSMSVPTTTIVKELKQNLDKIEEIDDYLVVTHTYALFSLDFLENLKYIRGNNLEDGKYALVVRSNENLMELWDPKRRRVTISNRNGSVLFHYNPKLCPAKIWEFVGQSGIHQPKDNKIDIGITNGDKVTCNTHILTVEIEKKTNNSVLIRYENFRRNLTLTSHLLSYEIHYKEAVNYPNKTVSKYDDRDPCRGDDWTYLEYPKISDTDVREMYSDNDSLDAIKREPVWESSRLIASLKHYAWYALYVKTIVIPDEHSLNNNTGAESNIIYFQTLPGVPSKPREVKAVATGPEMITLSWTLPLEANGRLEKFNIYLEKVETNNKLYEQRDYCKAPKVASTTPAIVKTTPGPGHSFTTSGGDLGGVTLAKTKDPECCSCAMAGAKTTTTTFDDQLYKDAMFNQIINRVFIAQSEVGPLGGGPGGSGDLDNNNIRVRRALQIDESGGGDSKEKEFPGESNSPGSVEPRIRSDMTLVESAEVKQGQLRYSIVLSRNLTHFTTYKVGVQACRAVELENLQEATENDTKSRCSDLAIETIQTLPSPNADNINPASITINVTDGNRLHVSWAEPVNPNGVVLAYNLRIHKVDGSGQKYDNPLCIPLKDFREKKNFTIEGLPVGNYSVKIQVSSLAKDSDWTEARYVIVTKLDGGISSVWVLIILLPVLFMIAVGVLLGYFYIRNKDIIGTKRIISANPEYMPNVDIPEEWEIPKDKLTILKDKELGQGSFGTVYEGLLRDFVQGQTAMRCAVKTVSEGSSGEDYVHFLNEAALMVKLDCRCHHVVKLLGVVSKTSPTCVVMELMTKGDLKNYLRSRRPGTYNTGDSPPTLKQILRMAAEIADGMAYIHKNRLVHRDLAARNCMVAEDLCVKVGDFGMTKEMLQADYYRKQTKGMLPVRWMSPESLRDGVFTNQSDVWSFGVVLWEMATLATQPYQGLGNNQVLDYVVAGNTMDRPTNCPDILYEMMAMCWRNDPRHRPSFIQILERLLQTDLDPTFAQVSFFHSPEGVAHREELHLQASDDAIIEIRFDSFTPLATPDDDDEDLDDYSDEDPELHHHMFDDLGDTPVRPLISSQPQPQISSSNPRNTASLLNGLSSSAPLHIHSQPRNGFNHCTSSDLQNHTIPAPNSTANYNSSSGGAPSSRHTSNCNYSPRPRTNSNNNNTNPRISQGSPVQNVNNSASVFPLGSSSSSPYSSGSLLPNGGLIEKPPPPPSFQPSSPKCSVQKSAESGSSAVEGSIPSKLTNGNSGGGGNNGGNGYIIRRTSPIHENPVNRTTQC